MTSSTHLAIAAATLAALSSPALAFRCGGYLVRPGDLAALVEARCGAPTARYPRYAAGRHGTVYLVGESWVYNFGPRSFVGLASIEGGQVVSVEYGDYGW